MRQGPSTTSLSETSSGELFRVDRDRDGFLERLGSNLKESLIFEVPKWHLKDEAGRSPLLTFASCHERIKRSAPGMEDDTLRQKRSVESKDFCFAVRVEKGGRRIK